MALPVREKHQMQLIHSLAEPRPPGIALRMRSNMANGPRSIVTKWLNRNVASDPKTRMRNG
jgi:hypothetical protein